ncbi:MAG: TolC family protein [Acidobacteria bacterium]|jgi:outer membrane protein|nr:TolC family protein [Acidobacteriota bacterium]
MNKTLCLFLLAAAAALPAEVTLSEAVVRSWEIHRGLDSRKLEEKSAAIAMETALRQQYFSVHFSGGYRYGSDKVQVRMSDFPFTVGAAIPPGTVILSAPSDTVDLKLSLLQPLYSGGLLGNAVKLEAARQAAAKALTRLQMIELAGRVKASYYSHLLFCRKRDALSFFLAGLEQHLGKLEDMYAEELARRTDLLEARTKADEVRLSLQDVEQLVAAEAVQFKSLTGLEPQEIEPPPPAPAQPYAAAWEHFLARHPLLLALDEGARQADIQRRSVAAAYLPQVSAFAEVHYGRPGQNFFVNDWTFHVQGGVSVALPVFNWNRRSRDLELAVIAGRKLENQRADFIRESEKSLRQLDRQRQAIETKLGLLDGLVAMAGEEVRLKERLYEESQIDHADLLAAMAGQERFLSTRGELLAQLELLKVNMDTLAGKCEEE